MENSGPSCSLCCAASLTAHAFCIYRLARVHVGSLHYHLAVLLSASSGSVTRFETKRVERLFGIHQCTMHRGRWTSELQFDSIAQVVAASGIKGVSEGAEGFVLSLSQSMNLHKVRILVAEFQSPLLTPHQEPHQLAKLERCLDTTQHPAAAQSLCCCPAVSWCSKVTYA